MTKEEAIRYVSNTKVYVNGKSEEIQKRLFKLDFKWDDGQTKETIVNYVNQPFLFINKNMSIGYTNDMSYFIYHKYKEIKAEEILTITIEEECPFKPFDRVLVRYNEREKWMAAIFSHFNEGLVYSFSTTNGRYKYCIPYEGNEHLVGTNQSPK